MLYRSHCSIFVFILFLAHLCIFNASWSPLNAQSDCFEIRYSTVGANLGDTVAIEVTARGFHNLITYQFATVWDTSSLKFLTFSTNGSILSGQLFGTGSANKGILRSLWLDQNVTGVSIPDDALLFKIFFRVLKDTPGSMVRKEIGVADLKTY